MQLTRKPLRGRELFAMMVMLIGLKGGDTTSSLLAGYGKNAFWLIPIISICVLLPSYLLLFRLLTKYDVNLIELILKLLGHKLGISLGLLIFLTSFSLMIVDARNYLQQINFLYFPNSPTYVIYLIYFLGVCLFISRKGIETIGSLSWVIFPFIAATILVVLALNASNLIWQRMFPIFGDGLPVLLKQGVYKSSIFLEFFLLTIAYNAFHSKKTFRNTSFFGMGMMVLLITTLYLVYTMVFDYNTIGTISFLYQESTELVTLGHFFTNLSTFFLVGWLVSSFLRFIIYLYLLVWIFGALFQITRFEALLLPFVFLTIILGLVTPSYSLNELDVRRLLLNISAPLYIAFPFFLWLASRWKEKRKNA